MWINKLFPVRISTFYISPLGHVETIININALEKGEKSWIFYELLRHSVASLMPQLLFSKAQTFTEVKEPTNQTLLCKSYCAPSKLHSNGGIITGGKKKMKFADLTRPQMMNELRWNS